MKRRAQNAGDRWFPEDADRDSARHYLQGRKLMDRGSLEEAIKMFRQSAAEDPHFKTLELLGECHMQLGQHRKAVVPLAAATSLNRGFRAPTLLAETLLALGDLRRAREMANLALQRRGDYRRALRVTELIQVRERQTETEDNPADDPDHGPP